LLKSQSLLHRAQQPNYFSACWSIAGMDRSAFWTGVKGGSAVSLASIPFAVLFGALAVNNGLTALDVALMSATIYAGASQLVGIELFGNDVAPWLIVFSIFAVNFRHVLYSATFARVIPHFTRFQKAITFFFMIDAQFAETARRGEQGEKISFWWYLGFGVIIYFPWIIFSVLGAWFGSLLGDPETWAFDVLLPVYFLGLVANFRRRSGFYPVVATSMLASVLAFHFVGSPWHVTIGAICGVAVAACLPIKPKAPSNEVVH
jgi:predicted branched-subunit amino acid permease